MNTLLPRIDLGSIQDVSMSLGYWRGGEHPMIGGMVITLTVNALKPVTFCLDGFQLRKLHSELCRKFKDAVGFELNTLSDWDKVELNGESSIGEKQDANSK